MSNRSSIFQCYIRFKSIVTQMYKKDRKSTGAHCYFSRFEEQLLHFYPYCNISKKDDFALWLSCKILKWDIGLVCVRRPKEGPSVHAAIIEAGFRKKTLTIQVEPEKFDLF